MRKILILWYSCGLEMGQTNSRATGSLNYLTITKPKLLDTIIALNARCEESLRGSSVNMIFAMEEANLDKKAFGDVFKSWKKIIRIRCFSVMNDRPYSKTYNLDEFLKLCNSFLQILDAFDASENIAPEGVDDRIMKMSIFQEEWCSIEGKCIICMDRIPNVVLPCMHAFCERCVNAFLSIRQRCCPLCRHQLDASTAMNDAWVITEKPVRNSINAYFIDVSSSKDCEDVAYVSAAVEQQEKFVSTPCDIKS